jgi:hypothetical protein
VALNGPLLAQIGRDGKTYPGRERSGMLEGVELVLTGDKRLHSRGHKKPAAAAKLADEVQARTFAVQSLVLSPDVLERRYSNE